LHVVYGPWFWVHMAYSYALLALGSFLLLRVVYRYPQLYRQQAGMLMIATLAPWVGNVLSVFGAGPAGGIDLTPFAFTITGVALALSMSRFRLFSLLPALLPTARNQVLQTMKDGVLVLDVDGRVVSFNPAASAMIGERVSELIGKPVSEILGDSVAAHLASDEGGDSQFEMSLGQGASRGTYDVVSSPLGLGGGIGVGRLLVIRDITEHKRSEQTLRLTQFSLDHAGDYVLRMGPSGRILYVSDSVCSRLGYSRAELLSMSVYDFTLGLLAETWPDRWQEIKKDKTLTFEKRLRAKDGEVFPVEVGTYFFEYEGEEYNCAFIRDISERKRAEEALRSSEDRYRQLFELESDAIVLVDNETGKILEVNAAAMALYGYGREEWLCMNHADVSAEPDKTRQAALEGHTQIPLRWHKRKDGTVFPVEITGQHFDWKGHSVHIAAIRDTTQRLEAERALRERDDQLRQSQKMEAVGQLAGGIAHDFNNLLTAIVGYSDLILSSSEGVGDSLRGDVEEIKAAADRASALTRQILAFSRRQALQPEVVSMNEIVGGTERLLCRTLGEDIDLVTLLRPELGLVEVDASQFEQMIMNLALNSRDAMPNGGKLTIETANVELSDEYCHSHAGTTVGPHVMLAVSDTGVGMDEETRSRVFEPFFTTKEPGKGTGLGLSTVYGTVKQSGGNIFVYSEPGKGTTVKVYLPRVDQPKKKRLATVRAPGSMTGDETILVVEDERAVRDLTARILKRLGYEVIDTANGDDALAMLGDCDRSVDMLLTDVVLPGTMQGNEVAEAVRLLYPRLPVLYMSGYTRDAIVHAGRLDEGVNYLEKPFTPDGLARRVREVLDCEVVAQ
jgi:two-component system cell cycle sensor histidine kinase/response regulator CckA